MEVSGWIITREINQMIHSLWVHEISRHAYRASQVFAFCRSIWLIRSRPDVYMKLTHRVASGRLYSAVGTLLAFTTSEFLLVPPQTDWLGCVRI